MCIFSSAKLPLTCIRSISVLCSGLEKNDLHFSDANCDFITSLNTEQHRRVRGNVPVVSSSAIGNPMAVVTDALTKPAKVGKKTQLSVCILIHRVDTCMSAHTIRLLVRTQRVLVWRGSIILFRRHASDASWASTSSKLSFSG